MRHIKFSRLFLLIVGMLFTTASNARHLALPEAVYLSGVQGYAQSFVLSCESRSAVDLMHYWGVTVSESHFFSTLPSSDNPNLGFVGNVNGVWGNIPPYSYGVHAAPVAAAMRSFGMDAIAVFDKNFSDLQNELASGRPVIVWVIGDIWSGQPKTYTSSAGDKVLVAHYEHTMILIGYDANYVYLVNAFNGANETHKIQNFISSWSVLGKMAIFADLYEGGTQAEITENSNTNAASTEQASYTVKSGDYLSKIARALGLRWQDIASLNQIYYPYTLHAGQVLKLPGNNSQTNSPNVAPSPTPTAPTIPQEYVVQRGDYLSAIAQQYNLRWQDLATLNNLSWPYTLYAGNILKLPTSAQAISYPTSQNSSPQTGSSTYTVQRGDYLVQLGRDLGVSWYEIASLNNLSYPYIVYPGQVLKIP